MLPLWRVGIDVGFIFIIHQVNRLFLASDHDLQKNKFMHIFDFTIFDELCFCAFCLYLSTDCFNLWLGSPLFICSTSKM
jgi:hypothetical protein